MKINDKVDKELTKKLKWDILIEKKKISKGIHENKLSSIFEKKVDNFYNDVILYTNKLALNRNLIKEINLFDQCNETSTENFINNFDEIQKKLKIYKSDFYVLSFLYKDNIEKNNSDFRNLYSKILLSWENVLISKILKARMQKIENARQRIYKDFYNKIQIMKKHLKILNIFPDYFDYFWHDIEKTKKLSFKAIQKYENFIRKNPVITKISDQLGRSLEISKDVKEIYEIRKEKKEEIKPVGSEVEEVIGIKESNDIEHLLPIELAYLSDEKLRIFFLKRFIENKLYTLDFISDDLVKVEKEVKKLKKEHIPKNKGDVIICVDTSNSMNGPFEFIAKTFTLGIVKNLINDRNRNCILINFSSSSYMLNINEIRKAPNSLNYFLSQSFSGGTNLDKILNEAIDLVEKNQDEANEEETKFMDILVISDFLVGNFSIDLIERIKNQKKNFNRFHAIQMGNMGNTNISKLFNNFWIYDQKDAFTSDKIIEILTKYNNFFKNDNK